MTHARYAFEYNHPESTVRAAHPVYTRSGDWNCKNRELLEETQRLGGNPYVRKYEEAVAKRVKPPHKVKVRCECAQSLTVA